MVLLLVPPNYPPRKLRIFLIGKDNSLLVVFVIIPKSITEYQRLPCNIKAREQKKYRKEKMKLNHLDSVSNLDSLNAIKKSIHHYL